MTNPPPLASPIPGFAVRAVLDQDTSVTSGLMVGADGRRAILLAGGERFRPGQAEEFTRWAGALADISAVARTAPVAAAGQTDDGRAYLACLVEPSMADHMRLAGQPDPRQVRHIGATVADVLATAHSYGLTHGAVCPATVMVTRDRVLLGGFGATAPALGAPIGTWAFMAPELRTGDGSGSCAGDVFALAATMCVALIGSVPWSGATEWADAAGLPAAANAPDWVAVVRDALSPSPDHRPNAEELAAVLRASNEWVKVDFHGARVDLRPLIPRRVRRLAAYSLAAMTDDAPPAYGRATVAAVAVPRAGNAGNAARVVRPRASNDSTATPKRASTARS